MVDRSGMAPARWTRPSLGVGLVLVALGISIWLNLNRVPGAVDKATGNATSDGLVLSIVGVIVLGLVLLAAGAASLLFARSESAASPFWVGVASGLGGTCLFWVAVVMMFGGFWFGATGFWAVVGPLSNVAMFLLAVWAVALGCSSMVIAFARWLRHRTAAAGPG